MFQANADGLLQVQLDLIDTAQASAATDANVACFGRIHGLVDNAGYVELGPFEETSAEKIERQYTANVFRTLHVMRAARLSSPG